MALAGWLGSKVGLKGITFVAFTATPKAKTLELFGRVPDPSQPASATNLPAAFHVYSMRQAIEEGFILDVLRNYTPYKLAFKLATESGEFDQAEVERSTALKALMKWVQLHPYNISQKVQVVVEHYRALVQPLLAGKAKAMVVVASRVEAVRWQLAIEAYIKSKGYALGTLVAYSGEVNDPQSSPDPLTETNKLLNPGLKGGDIRETFKGANYHVLLVTNKFQTGFDQPLLCGMYIDRRLAGIQAVQTLSRLNRAYQSGDVIKDTTYVLDFVNSSEEILAAFKTYYETATLEDVTDPNLVYDLRAKLDAAGHYDEFEVDRVIKVELNPKATHGDLAASISPVADRLLKAYKAAQELLKVAKSKSDDDGTKGAQDELNALILFKNDMGAFLRLYSFLSQIFDYGNTAIDARSIFYRRLIPLLEFGREKEGVDVSKVVLTHYKLAGQGNQPLNLSGGGENLQPMTATGSGSVQDKEKALLAEILGKLNDLFQGDLSDDDKLVYANHVLKGKLLESGKLVEQAENNSKEQFSNSPDLTKAILDAILEAFGAHMTMSKQALDSEAVREGLKEVLLGPGRLYEALRAKGASGEGAAG